MQLFQNQDNILSLVEGDSFQLERDIQSLVETNMEIIFGIDFVSREFTVGAFRLDSLSFDEHNNSFVIVEYKKGHSYSVVDQGYSYLSVMLNNKAEFILEFNEKNKKQLKKTDVDWGSSKVIFVSPSFNAYQKNSVNFRNVPFICLTIAVLLGSMGVSWNCIVRWSQEIGQLSLTAYPHSHRLNNSNRT